MKGLLSIITNDALREHHYCVGDIITVWGILKWHYYYVGGGVD